jgi:predicted PurR-regulated permease PerM
MKPFTRESIPFFIILAAVTLLFLYLLKPFFFPLFWAVVIAGLFKPFYKRLNDRWKRPGLSMTAVYLVFALIILLPVGVVGSLVFTESVQIYQQLSPGATTQNIDRSFDQVIRVAARTPFAKALKINESFLHQKIMEAARAIANYIFVRLTALTQNTLSLLVQFSIMLYALFFFIRDGDKLLGMGMRVLPLGMGREKLLYERFLATARSTIKVTLIIGGIQGALGGAAFLIADIEGAMIWGLLMVLMAVIPVVGCSIIWAPAGVLMLIRGHVWEGALILMVGVFVISTVDNLLRPVLIGKDVPIHPLLIFLSTLGGIYLFGFSGFVIGPIIAALLLAVWEMYDEYYRETPSA